jgi:NAD(P)-dependent dehydrogenase (short-subunit alcohol dehydrogenase family)
MGAAPRLGGRVAIVTGGSGGIGRATCAALADEGATVVVVDVTEAGVHEVTAALADRAAAGPNLGLTLDVRREADMQAMAERTLERFGRIDILVAAAGILRPKGMPPRLLGQMQLEEWDVVVDTNLRGVFLSNRAVLPAMLRQQAGQIVNVSSVQGRQGRAYDSAYCASKFGVIGLTESLAEEVRADGIRVHVVLPDAVETPMWEQNGPIGRPPNLLPPARVADFIVYLLALPDDTVLVGPVIAPVQRRRRADGGRRPAPQIDQASQREMR